MKVGFIGLGNIGMPMAKTLLAAGFDLTVFNRSRGKVDEMVALGAKAGASPAEIVQIADTVLACLPDTPTVEAVFLGADGIVANARQGQILVDHSTCAPATSQKIADAAGVKGAKFLDAPVSGLAERAAQGNLAIMVGGDKSAFEETLPVFKAMGRSVVHAGASGMGNVFKLANQAVAITNVVAAAEGFNLGVRLGADPQALLDNISNSSGQSFAVEWIAPSLVSGDFDSHESPVVRLLVKDLALAHQAAKEIDAPMPTSVVALELFERFTRDWPDLLDPAGVVLELQNANPK